MQDYPVYFIKKQSIAHDFSNTDLRVMSESVTIDLLPVL